MRCKIKIVLAYFLGIIKKFYISFLVKYSYKKMDNPSLIVVTFLVSFAILIVLHCKYSASSATTLERYEPEDMGGRRYWGFGREYGYSVDDTKQQLNFCYQITPNYVCRAGYTRSINAVTRREECCVNRYNY
jgi:hypothetical protein